MDSSDKDEQADNGFENKDSSGVPSAVNSSDEIKNGQHIQNIERTIGDGADVIQDRSSPERIQASTSKTNRRVRNRRYNRVRVIKPRASKDKAKHMITYFSKGRVRKSVGSFKRRVERSEATLKRSLHRRRSTDSVISGLCPICNHSCCRRPLQ